MKLMLIHHIPQHPLQTITRNSTELSKYGQVFNPSDSYEIGIKINSRIFRMQVDWWKGLIIFLDSSGVKL